MYISRLLVYPVKGCGGIEVPESALDAYGMRYDRNWVVVDENGRFISQRTHPMLCLVKPVMAKGCLVLSAPDMPELSLDLLVDGSPITVSVWDDVVTGTDVGEMGALWFSRYLGEQVRLAAIGPGYSRNVTHRDYVYSAQVHFGDAFPLLVIGQSSLDSLNTRLDAPVLMERFRPNIVIEGCLPHEEDTWCDIVAGETILRFGKQCARCKVTTIDQASGQLGKEPLKSLAGYRNFNGKVCFGAYYIPLAGRVLRVGDPVSIAVHTP